MGYWDLIRPLSLRMSRSALFQRLAPRVLPPLDRAAYRLSGGRILLGQKLMPSLMLFTVGHRTGLPRRTPLTCVPEPDGSFVVTASNFGRPRHPAWSENLLHSPEVTVGYGGRTIPVTARLLGPDEQDEVLPRVYAVWPVYRDYIERSGRQVRVFRLLPRRSDHAKPRHRHANL
ncbi:nitroreductase family deazaflavin-dependent oxidoreductase [Bailinhaonella thermotolerans]|uniref:Nitroreductase family deazaflavin-dependent oxidoreductase n=1 Tax=Bailinhaonella thermotolerans TaxID=1070861 RepID=A0A3A4BCU7_9ACTN|nr:nitroreductase family deazaflavin-dependent oxidoreductase [Bailinhaonella thermotolerans]RJL35926.1 nitroreductase family deazaflavin-dependent oxidoreductase [Bailinhaonella thermotolerans]